MDPIALRKLFLVHLKDIYSSEKQLAEALPRLIKAVFNKELKMVFREELEITKVQLSRLEELCAWFDENPSGENCNIMEGLLEEAEDSVEENESQDLIDLNIAGVYQKVKHFQIAGYGTLSTFARGLQEDRWIDLIQCSLDEEYNTESKLDRITEDIVQIYSKVII